MLNDRYELGELLGSGGMGRVYLARDLRLERNVAVKILNGQHVTDETSRARLRREAQIAGSLHHPGIAAVYDYDEDHATDGRDPFIVMQFVEGVPLSRIIAARGPIPPAEVASILAQVSDALRAAHDIGVVHRDLKPANIIITPARTAVLVDFGIAHSPIDDPLTATGSILGTVEYLSPEQASGRAATAQSDLYAMGVVAYVALTGTSPFRRDTALATAWAQVNEPIPPLSDHIPFALKSLVQDLMAKDPSDRPASAAEVTQRAAAQGGLQPVQVPITLEQPLTIKGPLEREGKGASFAPRLPVDGVIRRRRRSFWLPFLAAIVVMVAVGAAIVFRAGNGTDAKVPNVVGLVLADANRLISTAGMTSQTATIDHPTVSRGVVIEQSPPSATEGSGSGVVKLTIASGRMAIAASTYVGQPFKSAQFSIEKLGFAVIRKNVPTTGPAGTVLSLDRSGRLPVGATITISVVSAPSSSTSSPPTSSVPESPTNDKQKSTGNKGKGKGKK